MVLHGLPMDSGKFGQSRRLIYMTDMPPGINRRTHARVKFSYR